MKRLLSSVILGVTSLGYAHAQSSSLPLSVFVEYHENDANWYDQTVHLSGGSFGLSTSPYSSGFWGAVDFLGDDDFETTYVEARSGRHINLISQAGFYLNGTFGFGYAIASSPFLYNDVDFVTIPIGLEAGLSPFPELSVYAGVGYKWLYDVTSNTTCNDGTTTNNVGRRACYYNLGIAYFNDTVGNARGVEFKAGMRFNF